MEQTYSIDTQINNPKEKNNKIWTHYKELVWNKS